MKWNVRMLGDSVPGISQSPPCVVADSWQGFCSLTTIIPRFLFGLFLEATSVLFEPPYIADRPGDYGHWQLGMFMGPEAVFKTLEGFPAEENEGRRPKQPKLAETSTRKLKQHQRKPDK